MPKQKKLPDGSLLLSSELVERWERQINTSYAGLTDTEKESDREQVQKALPVIRKFAIGRNRIESHGK
jgi:hypothetical protein